MGRRVLICAPSHAVHGGVERIIESLSSGLPKRGLEVIVGLARGRRFHDPERYRAEYPSLTTVDMDGTGGRGPDRVRGIFRAIEVVDPDMVLITRLFDAYPAAAAMKMRRHRLRLGVTIQSFEPEYFVDAVEYAPFLDFCVTSGVLIKKTVERFANFPSDRCVSIPGGVSHPKLVRRELVGGPIRLGYVGRLESAQKRILDLPVLLEMLRNRGIAFTCTIAGSGPAEGELRDAIARLGLSERVTFRGWLSTDELYDTVYPELDVFLHFAEWEGITIAPREAMSHGVICVVSRFAGLRTEGQFIDESNALTFPIGALSFAADAVERIACDPVLRTRLSIAAASSQVGIRSTAGALDAWATALYQALERPSRAGTSLPPAPSQYGRLSWLPDSFADWIRKVRGAPQRHESPGSEWPHWSGRSSPSLVTGLRDFARSAE